MFIGILAHDLRNPLNAMLMASGLLIAHGHLTDEDARLVNRTLNSGQRMTRMIGQVADFARARLGGGVELKKGPSDLGDVCREIAEELRIGSSAEIRQTIEGDVGGTWDTDRLAEAVSNIAGNAVNHATSGTPVLITCSWRPRSALSSRSPTKVPAFQQTSSRSSSRRSVGER